MTTDHMSYRRRPCEGDAATGRCPWRRDATPGEFAASRFEAMRNTSTQPDAHDLDAYTQAVSGGQPLFACHMHGERPRTACAGWLQSGAALAGNLSIRVALSSGRLPAEALQPAPNCPELFDDYDEMARVMGDPDR